MDGICKHCGGEIAIRNPKGFCDHLYYPENCTVCSTRELEIQGRPMLTFTVKVSQTMVKGMPVKAILVPTTTDVPWPAAAQEEINKLANHIAETIGEVLDKNMT